MPAIEVRSVSKRFRLHGRRGPVTLKSAVVELFKRRRAPVDDYAALRDITLTVEVGQALGIVGENGSGKSTLLKIIAGIYRPDSGTVRVTGRLAALIELGAGFHPEFTGRENIIINGMVLGLSRREVLRRLDDIVAFADLGSFIDEPARTYSSGMFMRLGFSVAAHLDPDVLLIDEVLAIGDEAFAKKCGDWIAEFRRLGRTLVLVTHDPVAVERWCDDAIWLHRGVVQAVGSPRRVIDLYHGAVAARESAVLAASYGDTARAGSQRWGSRDVEIVRLRLTDATGTERYVFESGELVRATVTYRVKRRVERPVFGFAVVRGDGLQVYGTNTTLGRVPVPDLGEAGEVEITIDHLDLAQGSYYLDIAVHAEDGVAYDYHSRCYQIVVRSDSAGLGVVALAHRWDVKPQ
jgi:ABC-type polysaccharide/polyol phosphate transport system ATPase subunit